MLAVEIIAEHADKFDKLLLYAEKIVENQARQINPSEEGV